MMSLPRSPWRAYLSLLSCLVVAGLAGGCSLTGSSPAANFDLTAPRQVRAGSSAVGQVAVAEPAAVQPLESEKIVIKDANGAVAAVAGGQWADRLPRLVQSRLIQT